MSNRSSIKNALVAIAGALAVSTVAVGAAVAPAQAAGHSVQVAVNG